MKKTVIAFTFALGLFATGCGIWSTGQAPTTNTVGNNTVSPMGNTPSSDTSNNTVNNNTVASPTGDNNTTNTTTPPAANSSATVTTAGQATAIVQTMYAGIKAKDKNLVIGVDHTTSQDGHTVYAVHVYDNMPDHIATVAWINVRDDGKVQDGITPNGWVDPSQFPVS